MYDVFSSVHTQLHTTNLSKGGAKVEVLREEVKKPIVGRIMGNKNKPLRYSDL